MTDKKHPKGWLKERIKAEELKGSSTIKIDWDKLRTSPIYKEAKEIFENQKPMSKDERDDLSKRLAKKIVESSNIKP